MRVIVIEDDPEITEIVSMSFETAWPGSQVLSADSSRASP